jgi:phosphoglycerol transferase MdoB-like AlkP superfamily enzyme
MLGLLIVYRIVILSVFAQDESYGFSELLSATWTSFRFDLKLIATLLLIFVYAPALLILRFTSYKIVSFIRFCLFAVFVIITLLCFTSFGYYLFFGNAIDVLILGIVYDGTQEVISSIFGDTRLVTILIVSGIFIVISSYIFVKNSGSERVVQTPWKHYASLFFVIVLLVVLARGSFSTFPLSRKVANTTDNAFLNSLTLGPFWNLYYAYRDHQENDFKLTTKKILQMAKVANFDQLKKEAGYTTTNKLRVKTPKNEFLEKHPPHVIFVQQEGWSTQIALAHSEKNNILGAFAQHAKEDYLYKSFFSNAYGTSPTINNLLLNSPISGLSQSRASQVHFTTSSVLPFKENGYSINFLSGGSSSWRNHNQFWPRQGFDKYIGRVTIEDFYNYKCDNPWGVYEEYTYKYLQKLLVENIESGKPSFTFVLTTNNHGPIMLPPEFKKPKFDLEALGFDSNDEQHYTQLLGYMYQTDAFGKFLTWLKNSKYKDDVIVVATGDHILKGYDNYNSRKKEYLKYAVLTYFYLPKKYDRLREIPKDIVGSHNDLFPTLYELALSKTEYYNFGQPIMYKTKKGAYGWHEREIFLFEDGVVSNNKKLYKWANKSKEERVYLENTPKPISPFQNDVIEKTKKQILLKKYILLQEYEASKRKHE